MKTAADIGQGSKPFPEDRFIYFENVHELLPKNVRHTTGDFTFNDLPSVCSGNISNYMSLFQVLGNVLHETSMTVDDCSFWKVLPKHRPAPFRASAVQCIMAVLDLLFVK